MKDFINSEDLWFLMRKAQFEQADPNECLGELVNLFLRAHGQYGVSNNKLVFIPDIYAYVDHVSFSSSIISMTGNDQSFNDPTQRARFAMEEEFKIIKKMVKKFNKAFEVYDRHSDVWRIFFIEKNIFGVRKTDHQKKYNLYNNQYYSYKRASEYAVKYEFCLIPFDVVNPLQDQVDKAIREAKTEIKRLLSSYKKTL